MPAEKLENGGAIVEYGERSAEAAPESKSAKWRHSYMIKQLDTLEGSMDDVYRQLCRMLLDTEHETTKVIIVLRRNITKEGEVAGKLQEEAFCGYRVLTVQWLGVAAGVVGAGVPAFKAPKDAFQAWSTTAQMFQTPFQTIAGMEQQGYQSRQTKHGAEKTGTDQLGQQLDQDKSRLNELKEGIRRGLKEQGDSNSQLFSQIART